MDRMSIMEKTNDGFEIAQHDMKLRGFGDLGAGSEKQTGADNSFLYGRQLRIDVMDSVLEELENADKNSKQVVCKRGLATGHDLDAYDGCLQEASGQEKNCAHLRALS
jgi:RecG-like helicase